MDARFFLDSDVGNLCQSAAGVRRSVAPIGRNRRTRLDTALKERLVFVQVVRWEAFPLSPEDDDLFEFSFLLSLAPLSLQSSAPRVTFPLQHRMDTGYCLDHIRFPAVAGFHSFSAGTAANKQIGCWGAAV